MLPNSGAACSQWSVDNPKSVAAMQNLRKPEDLLGIEGNLGDKKLSFEMILDIGRNEIIYSLFCEQEQFRIAFGFPRAMFAEIGPS